MAEQSDLKLVTLRLISPISCSRIYVSQALLFLSTRSICSLSLFLLHLLSLSLSIDVGISICSGQLVSFGANESKTSVNYAIEN